MTVKVNYPHLKVAERGKRNIQRITQILRIYTCGLAGRIFGTEYELHYGVHARDSTKMRKISSRTFARDLLFQTTRALP